MSLSSFPLSRCPPLFLPMYCQSSFSLHKASLASISSVTSLSDHLHNENFFLLLSPHKPCSSDLRPSSPPCSGPSQLVQSPNVLTKDQLQWPQPQQLSQDFTKHSCHSPLQSRIKKKKCEQPQKILVYPCSQQPKVTSEHCKYF